MANRIANLLGNTKTRTLVLLVVGVLIFGVVIAVTQTDSGGEKETTTRVSKTTEVPNQVKSTPGEQVSRKYRELQEQANIRGAKEAEATGGTFIPTLTGSAEGYDDAEFDKQLSTAFDDIGGKCSKETVDKLRKEGLDNSQIILELKSYGCSAAAIASLFTPDELAAALLSQECEVAGTAKGCSGADAKKLKELGYDAAKIASTLKSKGCKTNDIASALKATGATPADIAIALKASGASAEEIASALKASGMSNDEIAVALKAAGSTPEEIAKALKATGATSTDIAKAMKASGATAAEIASGLKATGADINEIASALKATGADAAQIAAALSGAGFNNVDILAALNKAGFSPLEIAKAMSSLNLEGADSAALLAQQKANSTDAMRLAAQQESQQLAAYSQQRQAKIQELMSAMEAQKSAAMATWNEIPAQVLVQGEWAQSKDGVTGAGGSGGNGNGGTNGQPGQQEAPKIILKAGSILFGVIDTAVNSDEIGPVLATIVSGPLKGSRLMGTFKTQTDVESLSLTFNTLNMPSESKSMGISAVAIDPETARTALASDVDHHYFLRWGSLMAASFMQGYASAVASAGQTSTTSQGAAGTVTNTTTPALTGRQQLFEGLGAVATKWSEVVNKNFDRPNTVTIDQGTGVGILLTADLEYGAPIITNTAPVTAAAATAAAAGAPAAPASGLSTDQTAALISTLLKQQQAGTTTATVTSTGGK